MKRKIIEFAQTHPKVVFGVGLTASIIGLVSSGLGLSAAVGLDALSALLRPIGTFSNSVGSIWNLTASRAINGPEPIPLAAPRTERKILKFAQSHRKFAIGIGISALFIGMSSAGLGLAAATGLVAVTPIIFSSAGTVCSAFGSIWNHTISRSINKPAPKASPTLRSKIAGYAKKHPKAALAIGASATVIGFASAGVGLFAALGFVAVSPLIFSPLGTACGAFGSIWNFTTARIINGPVPQTSSVSLQRQETSSLAQIAPLSKEFKKTDATPRKKAQITNSPPQKERHCGRR